MAFLGARGTGILIIIGILGALATLTGCYFVYFYKPPVSVSDPEAVMSFFVACATIYAIIIGFTNIFIVFSVRYAGMCLLRNWLFLMSLFFFFTFFVVLFVPPTPFESVMWIARMLFLFAVATTTVITWHVTGFALK